MVSRMTRIGGKDFVEDCIDRDAALNLRAVLFAFPELKNQHGLDLDMIGMIERYFLEGLGISFHPVLLRGTFGIFFESIGKGLDKL